MHKGVEVLEITRSQCTHISPGVVHLLDEAIVLLPKGHLDAENLA
jgi:hypothetical protein